MNIVEDLKVVRRALDIQKQRKAELIGKKKQLLQQLKDDFGLDSLESAENEADKLEKQLKIDKEKLEGMVEKLNGMIGNVD